MQRWILLALIILATGVAVADTIPEGWSAISPRDELRPAFSYDAHAGRNGGSAFVAATDAREGLDGRWSTTLPVTGGTYYQFTAFYRAENVPTPRRCIVARIMWRDKDEQPNAMNRAQTPSKAAKSQRRSPSIPRRSKPGLTAGQKSLRCVPRADRGDAGGRRTALALGGERACHMERCFALAMRSAETAPHSPCRSALPTDGRQDR